MIRHLLLPLLILLAGGLEAADEAPAVDLRGDERPLSEILERLARQLDADLVVHAEAVPQLAREITIDARDVPWPQVVRLFELDYGLSLERHDALLEVVDADAAFARRRVLVRYPVGHLVTGITVYPSPDLALGGMGGVEPLIPAIADEEPPEIDDLIELIMETVAPESWSRRGASIHQVDDHLRVITVPEVQVQVAALLAATERHLARSILIELWSLEGDRDLPPVLAAEDWTALRATLGTPHGCLLLADEQRGHHHAGHLRASLRDGDVVGHTLDPLVVTLAEGGVVDCEAVATIGGVLLTTRLEATRLTGSQPRAIADAADGDERMTLELSRQQRQRAGGTRLVPAGAAAVHRAGDRIWILAPTVEAYAD